jgi:anti-sigma regulatory factor (Ser/Thr protein kinase)
MRRTFPTKADSLRQVRLFIRERAEAADLVRRDAEDLVLAVSEVCANAVQHADGGMFVVSWKAGPQQPTEVKVKDEGIFASQGVGDVGRPRGFGLPLVAALVDELSIARGTSVHPGTEVRMLKYRDD